MKKFVSILSGAALMLSSFPVLAGTIMVENSNEAVVSNTVMAYSSSGYNLADGAGAVNTVSGGAISGVGQNNTIDLGENIVAGGNGGTIETGDSTATSLIENTLNWNDVVVTHTQNSNQWFEIHAHNTNAAIAANDIQTITETGINSALSGGAVGAVVGGGVTDSGSDNLLVAGGNAVVGGNGGEISTGESLSISSIVTILNRNISRITSD